MDGNRADIALDEGANSSAEHEEPGEMNTRVVIEIISCRESWISAGGSDGPEAGASRRGGELVAFASEEGTSGGSGKVVADRGDGEPGPAVTY